MRESAWKAHLAKECKETCYYCNAEKNAPIPTKSFVQGPHDSNRRQRLRAIRIYAKKNKP